jgi:UDP-N-acetylmuramoylalanine--D-glutamate ligase
MAQLPRSALVLGLARSGRAAVRALAARQARVVAVDSNPQLDIEGLEALATVVLGRHDASLLDGVEVLVKSPGVPGDAPLVVAARAREIPVWSEVELGGAILPNPLVGVTGTNGKTTTTELLGAIFRAAGRDVAVAGNIGTPVTSLDREVEPDAWIVCELSSFQLEDVHELRLRVAVLLNLEPDHLDRHGSVDAYRDAKLRIFDNQEPADIAVVPRGFGAVPGRGRRVEFAASDRLPAEPLIPGAHNRENAAAAAAAARAVGIEDAAVAEALRTFPGIAHRLELVAERDGVRFVNDSKATNTAAARRSLAAYDAPLHLILGGSLKGESFAELAREVGSRAASVHLVGEAADELAAALDAAHVGYSRDGTVERAVTAAAAAAQPGDLVLLSPACASYDQFRNFEHRGEEFRRVVSKLVGCGSTGGSKPTS